MARTILKLVSAFLLFGFIAAAPGANNFEDWFSRQHKFSLQHLLKNINPPGTVPGVVVASPSKRDPDYWYHWIRDAALVVDVVNDQYELGNGDLKRYEQIFRDFASLSRRNQLTPTKSGVNNLGEPKFNVDGSAFNDDWGRPQNDGPALRAMSLMRFAELNYNKTGSRSFIDSIYKAELPANTVVKADLEFVAREWTQLNYDLWEEIIGRHFYTMMVQRRALLEGARFAETWFGDKGAAGYYRKVAGDISQFIDSKYWDSRRNYLMSNIEIDQSRSKQKPSNLDCSVVLASLHSKATTDGYYGPENDRVLRTVAALKDSFQNIYTINRRVSNVAPGIGRYPEDVYDGYKNTENGGNPWFICTAAVSELYSKFIDRALKTGKIDVTPVSKPFFDTLANGVLRSNGIVIGSYQASSPQFTAILSALKAESDSYFERIRIHASKEGNLSEQFNRETGFMQGAPDLTWSYGSFVTAGDARKKVQSLVAKL
ncbi:Six-hairpin glycosidase-like protein [Paraphysoderma sedebokerense]|nr:Six-hairpin glycosidase-like protein [Paraphysoderma sedebokerense]